MSLDYIHHNTKCFPTFIEKSLYLKMMIYGGSKSVAPIKTEIGKDPVASFVSNCGRLLCKTLLSLINDLVKVQSIKRFYCIQKQIETKTRKNKSKKHAHTHKRKRKEEQEIGLRCSLYLMFSSLFAYRHQCIRRHTRGASLCD